MKAAAAIARGVVGHDAVANNGRAAEQLHAAAVSATSKGMAGIITALDNRVKTMNHDVIRIDTIVSNALGLKPDTDRIARADGKTDARRD